ncbi:DUF6726 family protein [Paraburkholderia aspalathi]|uniref:DUF6726 family protein n=1 Tax=Paraburkholderia aspalathi TaxID=1324617 RepID=UPI003CBFCF68
MTLARHEPTDHYQNRGPRIAFVLAVACVALTGCGVVAAPCRIASAGLKIVPLVGHVAAVPTDACAAAIDP